MSKSTRNRRGTQPPVHFDRNPLGRGVGCFSALLAPYVSIQDTFVDTASPARAASKNSHLTCGETYAYFGGQDTNDGTCRATI